MSGSFRTLLTSRRQWLRGIAVGTLAGSAGNAHGQGVRAVPDRYAGMASAPAMPGRRGVSPLDFEGGTIDDRLALAITSAIERIEVLELGGLSELALTRPMVLSRPHPGHAGAWVAPKSVRGRGTRIVAAAPMDCLVVMRNCFGKVFDGFRLDGQGRARMLLDTSWTVSPAPAMNCRWSDLDMRGAAGPMTWRADGNNDCDFAFIAIQGPQNQPGHVAISLQCSGGDLTLLRTRIYGGKLLVAAQSIALAQCQTVGIKVFGKDFNLLNVLGGYHYAAPDSRTNIEIDDGAANVALNVEGAHVENGYPAGVVLGGGGVLRAGATFTQCHVFGPGDGAPVHMAGPALRSSLGSGVRQIVRLAGGTYDRVDLSDTAEIALSPELITYNQAPLTRRRAGGTLRVLEDAEAGLWRQEHPAWGPLATIRSITTAQCVAGRSVSVPLDGWPALGRVFVRSTNDQCPRAMLDYDLASGGVTEADGFRTQGLRVVIRDGALVLGHDVAGETTVFLLAAFGL